MHIYTASTFNGPFWFWFVNRLLLLFFKKGGGPSVVVSGDGKNFMARIAIFVPKAVIPLADAGAAVWLLLLLLPLVPIGSFCCCLVVVVVVVVVVPTMQGKTCLFLVVAATTTSRRRRRRMPNLAHFGYSCCYQTQTKIPPLERDCQCQCCKNETYPPRRQLGLSLLCIVSPLV